MTDVGLAIEREKWLSVDEDRRLIRTCPECEATTYRDYCPVCGSTDLSAQTGDPLLDEAIAADGEKFHELFGK